MQSATQVDGKTCMAVRGFATNLFIMASTQLQPAHKHEQCRSSMVVSWWSALTLAHCNWQLAVAGTPNQCHANTAANTAANKANIAACPSKHTAAASSLQLAAYDNGRPCQTMSCKHIQSKHGSLLQQACSCSQLITTGSCPIPCTLKPCHANTPAKHSSKQSTHSSLSQQAYICSQLTATGSYAVAGTPKPQQTQ